MFGNMKDMMGMMGKLKEAQQKVEETKARLDHEFLHQRTKDGKLEIRMSVSQKIQDITLSNELLQDKNQLEDYLIITLNKIIKKAKDQYDRELEKVAKDRMPKIPNL
ncbi:MAG: YbaB/EbfC family nucleoid-associated protein [Flavobacteriales bacterium]